MHTLKLKALSKNYNNDKTKLKEIQNFDGPCFTDEETPKPLEMAMAEDDIIEVYQEQTRPLLTQVKTNQYVILNKILAKIITTKRAINPNKYKTTNYYRMRRKYSLLGWAMRR